jgi:chemotaxis methyl-accepting protein methylase
VKTDLDRVADLLRRETGVSLKPEQMQSLAVALDRVQPGLDASGFLAARVEPARRAALMSALIDEVTVRETFFLRQREELEAVEWAALLDGAKAAGRDRVSVWVAACASGEEAYSLALLACEAFASGEPPVSILATDISGAALASARVGHYGRRSLRPLHDTARTRFFRHEGERLSVGEELRTVVTFAHHNLARDPIPPLGAGPFDVIACRNVLIYFDGDAIERVLSSLERALAPRGILILGAADRLCGSARRLAKLEHDHAPMRRPALRAPQHVAAAQANAARARVAQAVPTVEASRAADLHDVLRAADAGDLELAIGATARILRENPLDCDAQFIRGLAELGRGEAHAAVKSFRRVLYIDPAFGLAAFKLGRAYEACGERTSAYSAYERALRSPRAGDGRHALVLDHIGLGDVAAACAIRLRALSVKSRDPAGAGRAR